MSLCQRTDLHSDLLVKEAPVGTPPSEVEIQGEKEGKRDKEEDEDPFSSSISVRQRDGIGVTVRCLDCNLFCVSKT